jgi:hypothetical protein
VNVEAFCKFNWFGRSWIRYSSRQPSMNFQSMPAHNRDPAPHVNKPTSKNTASQTSHPRRRELLSEENGSAHGPCILWFGFVDVLNSVSVVTWHRLKVHRWLSAAVCYLFYWGNWPIGPCAYTYTNSRSLVYGTYSGLDMNNPVRIKQFRKLKAEHLKF